MCRHSIQRPCLRTPLAHALALVVAGVHLAAANPAPTFVDATPIAEVDYIQWAPPQGTFFNSPEVMTGGAAVADYDNDGWTDLFVTRYRDTDILFRNRGDGVFEIVGAEAGINDVAPSNGAAWGDIDNDGDSDLYVNVMDESANPLRNLLYINRGDGTFTEEAQARGAALQTPHFQSGFSLCLGDYDRDGSLDIHTCQWQVTDSANQSVLLRNSGTGYFADVTAAAGVQMWDDPQVEGPPESSTHAFASRLTDIDRDGWPDLLVAGDYGTSRLFWNKADGSFADGTAEARIGGDENGMGLAVGDYDGDGLFDLFFTSIFDARGTGIPLTGWGVTGNRLYRNLGGRVFEDATDAAGVRDGGWGWGAVFFDYDNDGDLDLAMTNGFESDLIDTETPFHTDPTTLWRNDGGIFTDVSLAEGISDTGSGKGLLVFDYDKDGDLDLFVVNNAGAPVLYRNDSDSGNHWLRVVARGSCSNRDGIGTLITVSPGDGAPGQVREISGGSHYLAQSEKVAHFGLGASGSNLETVTVRWPSGIEQRIADVAVDQVLEVTEPESPWGAWLAQHFTEAERAAAALSDPLADPDRDGLNNVLEFGCGLDPRRAQRERPIGIERDSATGETTLSWHRRNLPRGIQVDLHKSGDLAAWQACDPGELEILSIEPDDDWGVETVTARLLTGPQPAPTHLRLSVSITE